MALSPSSIPKRWRLFIVVVILFIILCQVLFTLSRSSLIPLDKVEETPVIKTSNEKQPTQQEPIQNHHNTPEPPIIPPKKVSILNGFGGFYSKLPQIQHNFSPEPEAYTLLREQRRAAVKESFMHGWHGYKTYALGHDELKPLSNVPTNPFGGWGATMIDSLSTLFIMELDDEVINLAPLISKINFKVDEDINVFESTIRYMGGFISAFELGDRRQNSLLQRAEKLAQALLPAFDTPSGLPHHLWNPVQNAPNNRETLVAEVGTVQLEFMMLSQLTGNPIYGQKAQIITDFLDNAGYEHGMYIKGLYPTALDTHKGRFKNAISTFGAMGDSVFEYFLKEYLLVDGSVPQYARMYTQSIRSMKKHMLRQVPEYDLLMLAPFDTQHMNHKNMMDHLTCFVPGMLAMGAKTLNEPEDMEIAKGLLETCVYMYRTTETGLCAENWSIQKTEPYNPMTYNKTKAQLSKLRDWWYDGESMKPVYRQPAVDGRSSGSNESIVKRAVETDDPPTEYSTDYKLPPIRKRPDSLYFGDKRYVLRPETVESLFILYRMTGDQKYQEYGWEIYQSIEKWCKTESAYAVIRNVDRAPKLTEGEPLKFNQIDSMESFLFAETFKYLYLLFSPSDILSLDKFIFNTEAHPFVRRHWNWDKVLKAKK